jgi:Protein of unknown function (DUF3347)
MKQVILLAALLFASISNQAQAPDPVKTVLDQYMAVKDALVASDPADAAKQANLLLKSLGAAKLESLKKDTKAIADSKDLPKQREAFASLSDKLYTAVKAAKPATTIYYQHCPMYNSGKGGNWLSLETEIKNPFYGDMMLNCGSTTDTIKK